MLEKLNAQDVVILDVRQKCNWASFFLVASAPSTKQLQGISESLINQVNRIREKLEEK
jgi:ribosomal silencing factor RsfS